MKIKTQIIAFFFILTGNVACTQNSEWEDLFNGKDLSGWTVMCQPQDRGKQFWTVDNGTIYCNSFESKDHNYIWLVTDREFSDFELHLKFQVYADSPGNSGLQFRSRYDPDLKGGWLNGPQVDIHPPKYQQWRTGFVYDETLEVQRWIFPSLPDASMRDEYEPKEHVMRYAGDGDGWNEMILICKGMYIQTILNGITLTDWDATGVLDDENHRKYQVGVKGHIALQLHSRDQLRIRFKDIRIKTL